jgi:hypothetical protein
VRFLFLIGECNLYEAHVEKELQNGKRMISEVKQFSEVLVFFRKFWLFTVGDWLNAKVIVSEDSLEIWIIEVDDERMNFGLG